MARVRDVRVRRVLARMPVLRQHSRRRPAHDVPELPRRHPRPVIGQTAPA